MNPSYLIRVSQKARHVRFQVTPQRGLEVIIPRRFDPAKVPALIARNRLWIERAISKVRLWEGSRATPDPWQMPTRIFFRAINAEWEIELRQTSSRSVLVREPSAGKISLFGAVSDPVHCRLALGRWLTRMATIYLVPWLERVCQETGLQYSGVSIKQQKTRWGSCSSRKKISLNARLLFLPAEVVHYILLHELCHTKQLNHSVRFWRLVESYLPNYREIDRVLRKAEQFMPAWIKEVGVPKA